MHNVIEPLWPLLTDIEGIEPDTKNARSHPARNLEAITASLAEFGQRKPIVVRADTKHVEAGNGMFEGAKALGWSQIAAVFVDDDPQTATAYGIMDNQSALLAGWDIPQLSELLQELDESGFDMDLTGFDEDERTEFIHPEPEGDAGAGGEGLTDNYKEQYGVVIICESESHQQEVYEKLEGEGYNCKVVVT